MSLYVLHCCPCISHVCNRRVAGRVTWWWSTPTRSSHPTCLSCWRHWGCRSTSVRSMWPHRPINLGLNTTLFVIVNDHVEKTREQMYLAFHTCICKRVPKKPNIFYFTNFLCRIHFPFPDGSTAVSAASLLQTDMVGKVITHMVMPVVDSNTHVRFYKVAKRIQVGIVVQNICI